MTDSSTQTELTTEDQECIAEELPFPATTQTHKIETSQSYGFELDLEFMKRNINKQGPYYIPAQDQSPFVAAPKPEITISTGDFRNRNKPMTDEVKSTPKPVDIHQNEPTEALSVVIHTKEPRNFEDSVKLDNIVIISKPVQ
jgi:hypothetical protein